MKLECNSVNAKCEPPVEYCEECSHAIYTISVLGKLAQYNPHYGIVFLTSNKKKQPKEDHILWELAERTIRK